MKRSNWVNPVNIISKLLELRASLQIILLLLLLFVIVAAGGSIAISNLKIFSDDAYAINNMGVVRGSIQRITKREITHKQSDPLIEDVDITLNAIKQRYLTNSDHLDYLEQESIFEKLERLEDAWKQLKQLIVKYRNNESTAVEVLFQSERCWEKAHLLTFSIQVINEKKLGDYKSLIFLISITVSVFIFSIILIVYRIVHKHLEVDVITDSMTKLHNRSYFNQVVKSQINLSKRYNFSFSLVLLDIDHFKMVNDDFGHPVGDKVLIKFSELLRENVRDVDYVFRLGGEEFAIIAPQCTSAQSRNLAEKFRDLVSNADFSIGRPLTISIGVSQFNDHDTSDELFIRTDKALYQAKESGRNTVIIA